MANLQAELNRGSAERTDLQAQLAAARAEAQSAKRLAEESKGEQESKLNEMRRKLEGAEVCSPKPKGRGCVWLREWRRRSPCAVRSGASARRRLERALENERTARIGVEGHRERLVASQ